MLLYNTIPTNSAFADLTETMYLSNFTDENIKMSFISLTKT